ncbi:SAM-dependent methyltransferase [Micromonospora sp. NPDC050397]|uniref:SAM-dependent methyltransferase n=1 Tax=Micromonospora sp. NPDC050397 TaxID=3364279 RepID=UPI0038500FA3
MTDSGFAPIDRSRPHPARRYDYWLGGKDNFAADRESADQIAAVFPQIRGAVGENRRFLRRVVSYLAADAGVRQFLDIGIGFPNSPNAHEVAQVVAPASRFVYVDNDPMVVSHARGRMTSTAQGTVTYVQADLREPEWILADPALTAALDLDQPVGLLLVAVLHYLADSDDPYGVVRYLVEALPAGSYVAVSHATFDNLPPATVDRLASLVTAGAGHGTFRARTRGEVARFLDGLTLVDPGLCSTVDWRPGRYPHAEADAVSAMAYAAVARVEER